MEQTLTRVVNDVMATGLESPLNTLLASSHITLREELAVRVGKSGLKLCTLINKLNMYSALHT